MENAEFETLRARVVAGSRLAGSYDHGERHWRAVALAGLELLAASPDADTELVLLFALFHDARRENEFDDPQHGLRGAELARSFGFESDVLYAVCRDHNGGPATDHPTMGVCFDADRLNLWRVGIEPDPALLSTIAAPALIERAQGYHDEAPQWAELLGRYAELSGS